MDVALTVGGSFLSAFLQVLFDRMAKPEFLCLFREPKYDVRGILKKLKLKLLILQPVLDDAENKQTKDPAVKDWLEELQDVIYQADDLLDQINTEALRVQIESQYQTSGDQVSASKGPSNLNIEFLKDMIPRIEEVVDSLEEFVEQIHVLGLVTKVESKKQPFLLPSTSLVDETGVYGRDADKDKIIGYLVSDGAKGDKVTVISIVGLGGLGKTTLAQLIYSDKSVKDHFEITAWVCISEEYDAIRITKELLQELNIHFGSNETFNSLQEKLKLGLSMKRFLLVLDDVWNSNYSDWLILSTPFSGGKEGSKIIVTTRDENVARMMRKGPIHHLDLLSKDDCWLLFQKHAMSHRDSAGNLGFVSVGKDIMQKCGRLPLAIKAIAGVLRLKETIEEWKEILTSDEWEETNNRTGILPSLRLSYNHLSPQLKGCFALCAVFYKDYQFSKDEVILLWMANGLLDKPKSEKRLEDRGEEYFRELRFRSLFQQSSNGKFSMHDLVNDLAKFVTGKFVYKQEERWQQNSSSTLLIGVRHFSYLRQNSCQFEKFKLPNEAKFLRTFLPMDFCSQKGCRYLLGKKLLHDILATFKSLRFLSLSHFVLTDLPDSIANLKQLRCLDLCSTNIRKLPSGICALYNLQTLLLANCYFLEELPEGMERLINLRYLDLSRVRLSKMPMQIERIQGLEFLSLSTYTAYTVGKDGSSRIEELGKICNLHGALTISRLENVDNGDDALMARMKDKKHIQKLRLVWSGDDSNDSKVVNDVLENLQPHSNIKAVEVEGYNGTRFSNWLGNSSYSHMTSLHLSNCENCFWLPALGQLPSLKYLLICELSKVLEIGQEIYGDTKMNNPFPCLENLEIMAMDEWRKWHIPENGAFPVLQVLSVVDCPKLMGDFSRLLSSLRTLRIGGCPGLVSFDGQMTIFDSKTDVPQQFCSLHELVITNLPNLKELSSSSSSLVLNKFLPNLENITIEDCPDIMPFPIDCLPHTLQQLKIAGCGNLELESPKVIGTSHLSIKTMASLTEIVLQNCNLKSLPKGMHSLFPSLQTLKMYCCSEIECFPEGGLPSSLNCLEIENCHKLVSSLREWGLQRLPFLIKFSFGGSHEESLLLEDLQLPCTLQSLSLNNHENLEKLMPLQHLTCLESLFIVKCPKLQLLPDEELPTSLSSLYIWNCQLLKSRFEWEYRHKVYIHPLTIGANNSWERYSLIAKIYHSLLFFL